MTEETLSSEESLLLPPWPGCAGHVKISLPLEQPTVREKLSLTLRENSR